MINSFATSNFISTPNSLNIYYIIKIFYTTVNHNNDLGNTDISDIGSTVTGAIHNLQNAKSLYSVSKSKYSTNAAALADLYSFYTTIPSIQKFKVILVRGTLSYTQIAPGSGAYGVVSIEQNNSGTRFLREMIIELETNRIIYGQTPIEGSGSPSFTDISSTAPNLGFTLYLV